MLVYFDTKHTTAFFKARAARLGRNTPYSTYVRYVFSRTAINIAKTFKTKAFVALEIVLPQPAYHDTVI